MKLKEDLTLRKIGDDYVIISPDLGMLDLTKVYSLNDTAALIWQQLQGRSFELDDMLKVIREHFKLQGIPEEQLKEDLNNLISFFKDNNLLEKENG